MIPCVARAIHAAKVVKTGPPSSLAVINTGAEALKPLDLSRPLLLNDR